VAPEAWLEGLVDGVQRSHFEASISHLASFPNRFSTGEHYRAAAAWVQGQLGAMQYNAETVSVSVGNKTTFNVIADKPGAESETPGLVMAVAHLDSLNQGGGPASTAPGADDNASGSAGLLEIARVLKDHRAVNDLRLVFFGGEEQGLFGSRQFVAEMPAAERERLQAVVNMDMIGSLNTVSPTALIEGTEVSQTVIGDLAQAATDHTSLTIQTSLKAFASDHVPFLEEKLPAVLTIEGADGANEQIHTANDTLTHISYELAVEILRMNVAYIASLLGRAEDVDPC
jgi:Zn-dependent M28 family amino/carboxypeptidase